MFSSSSYNGAIGAWVSPFVDISVFVDCDMEISFSIKELYLFDLLSYRT